jgi:eukaryotic-like serine/threonine-protein kinase
MFFGAWGGLMQVGTELAGRYRLEALLGRGGMGEVWRAGDLRLRRLVAVKILPLTAGADQASVARFRREAEIAAALNHPGITTVFDIDEHKDGDQRLLFLVMELMQGADLASVLAGHPGGLPAPQVKSWAVQILDALAVAHGQGVVHRDIKPANLFVVTGGRMKICDFGIARLADTTKITATGSSAGTPLYMAPEQIQGRTVDRRTDLYAFGCVLYEMLTGTTWIDTRSGIAAILYQHLDHTPPPLRPDIPHQLNTLVLDLLAKQPDDRPGDAVIVAERLRGAPERRDQGRQPAPAPTIDAPAAPPGPATAAAPPQPTTQPAQRGMPQPLDHRVGQLATPAPSRTPPKGIDRRTILLGGLGAVVVAGVPVAALLSNGNSNDAPPAKPIAVAAVATLACPDDVWAVAFSPDGKTLATGSSGGSVLLWDVATAKITATLTGATDITDAADAVAFSPDGKVLAASWKREGARLWDVATGRPITTLPCSSQVLSMAFSPDGKTLATDTDGDSVLLWDVATARTTATLSAGDGELAMSVAFSPDGKTLATAPDATSGGAVQLWDVAERKSTAVLTDDRVISVDSVAFSPDGKTVAGGGPYGGDVALWDVAAKSSTVLTGHTDDVKSVAFSPDGKTLATGSYDKTARLWDVATGTSVATITAHHQWVYAVAFSPDGKTLATGGWDRTARLWKIP